MRPDEQPQGGETTGGAGTAAMQLEQTQTAETPTETQAAVVDYADIGSKFTDWFNTKLKLLPNVAIQLGTKTAHVVGLHPDGRLECEVEGEGTKNEQQFVVFEMQHFDQLLRRITAATL